MAEKTYFTLSDNFNGLPKPQPAEDTRKVFELAYVSLDVTQGTEEDEQKLTRVINRLAKDKNAREILERIEEKGTKIAFVDGNIGAHAFYDGNKNRIVISKKLNENQLVSAFIHECQHGIQDLAGENSLTPEYNVSTMMRTSKVHEADAVAHQMLSLYSLKLQGDSGPWDATIIKIPELAKKLELVGGKNPYAAEKAFLATAFKGWFETKFLPSHYEKNILEEIQQRLPEADKEENGVDEAFRLDVSNRELLTRYTQYSGGNYIDPNSKILDGKLFSGIEATTKFKLDRILYKRHKKYGVNYDTSLKRHPAVFPREFFPNIKKKIKKQTKTAVKKASNLSKTIQTEIAKAKTR